MIYKTVFDTNRGYLIISNMKYTANSPSPHFTATVSDVIQKAIMDFAF